MSGFDYAQQERRIASLESNRGASLRFGTVTGVDTATGTARVQLPDGDGMVTMPLRVLGRRTLKDKAQALPDIGEPVACLFSGQGLEQGVILGAHYTAKTPSPNQEAQVDYVRYEDGTELWYDRKGHKLTAKVKEASRPRPKKPSSPNPRPASPCAPPISGWKATSPSKATRAGRPQASCAATRPSATAPCPCRAAT